MNQLQPFSKVKETVKTSVSKFKPLIDTASILHVSLFLLHIYGTVLSFLGFSEVTKNTSLLKGC